MVFGNSDAEQANQARTLRVLDSQNSTRFARGLFAALDLRMEKTYRAAPSSYIVLVGLVSIPSFLWLLVMFQNQNPEYLGLLVSLCLPLFLGVWLASFRLVFSETGITYRSLFAGTRTAAYSDIKTIGTSRVAPFSRSPLGVTIQLHTGKDIVVNTKPFPIEAAQRLMQISESNKPLKNRPRVIRAAF